MSTVWAKRVTAVLAGGMTMVATTWACLDLTPVTQSEVPPQPMPDVVKPALDASPPPADSASDAAFEGDVENQQDVMVVVPPCQACIERADVPGPGCMTELAACLTSPACTYVWNCTVANDCLLLPTRDDLATCADPCVIEAGITSASEGPGLLVANLAVCATGPCSPPCVPSDS